MDPFVIVCSSCASRLKVTNPSSVGQVLACPKCGNMVKVVAPKNWKHPQLSEDASASSPATSHTGDPALSSSSTEQATSNKPATVGDEFDEIDALLAGQKIVHKRPIARQPAQRVATVNVKPSAQSGPSIVAKPDRAKQSGSIAQESAVLPTNQWMAEQSRLRQRGLLLVFGLLAIVVTGVVTVAALWTGSRPDTPVAQSDNVSHEEDGTKDRDSEIDPDDGREADSALEITVPNLGSEGEANVDEAELVELSGEDDDSEPGVHHADAIDAENMPDEIDRGQLPLDAKNPLQDGMANWPLQGLVDGENARPKSALDGLEFIQSMLAEDRQNISMLEQLRSEQRPEKIGISRLYVAKPSPFTVNIDQSLEYMVNGFRTRATLRRFLDRVYQIGRVPFSVNVDALLAMQVDFQAEQDIVETEISVANLVEKLLTPRNLVLTKGNSSVLVVSRTENEISQKTYDIPGIELFNDDELQSFVNLITHMLPGEIWDGSNGETISLANKQLVCRNVNRVHWRIDDLLRKLAFAVAVKENNASPDMRSNYRPLYETYLQLKSLQLDKSWILNQRLEFILDHLETDFGVTVLVDWDALAGEGWNPDVLVPWDPENRNIVEMMDDLTHAMKLEWRLITPNLIQLTTRKKFIEDLMIEVYPLSNYPNSKLEKSQLGNLIERQLASVVGAVPGAIVAYNPKYECILAVAPQDLQFQISKTLRRLNGDDK
ncbi:MAG TPA: hypothetical protein PKD64_16015 [Pirellulaceae bacterium]|nr:hypothetical protein [Pirellulaceae bacterium]HMO93694.1 hypothetical protein [Pirellulaceae bacterium]HMP71273.1 hypothetical protein [Pirellulaceae bacterium]